jgi:indole-3-glycerol phosphate synthase
VDLLANIVAFKRKHVDSARRQVSLSEMRDHAMNARDSAPAHRFRSQLSKDAISIIAEFKRRSPSRGVIRAGTAASEMARWYEAGGAAAISVLTEENFFDGCLEDLRAVKQTVSLPVLRKDFIIDEYQVFESLVAGADAILLIVAALDNQGLEHLRQLAEDELGMDALVEVHTEGELRRAESCGARLIGVNNRDLKTFEVSLETSIALAARAPSDTVLVSESGLRSHGDLLRLRGVGFSGFLVGETLMRAASPVNALRELIGDAQVL